MIITQTRQTRTFIGSLNPGSDVIDALRHICVDNAILCATFTGVGYLQNPRIQVYDLETRGFSPPVVHSGTFHCVSLHGNASLQDKQTVLRTHVIGTITKPSGHPPALLSGELVGATVIAFEFTLDAIDDIRLYRAPDDRTGLDPWLHMSLGGPLRVDPGSDDLAAPPHSLATPEVAAAPAQPGAAASTPVEPPPEEPAPRTGPQIEVEAGDWLEHPTLGRCEVVDSDGDERVTIKLGSGRRVELHVGLLDLKVTGEFGGKRLIKVAIKRRR